MSTESSKNTPVNVLFLVGENNPHSLRLAEWLANVARENVAIRSDPIGPEAITSVQPDVVVSYNYRHRVTNEVLRLIPERVINLHIALLPWNRGAHPNLWSILDATPKGVTIHLMDDGWDTGAILLQKEVAIDEGSETLESSYDILHREIQELFMSNWDGIKTGAIGPTRQPPGGSIHYLKDFETVRPLLGDEGWQIAIGKLKSLYARSGKKETSSSSPLPRGPT